MLFSQRNYGCRISESRINRAQVVTLENRSLRVSVLAGFGATIFEFLDKRTDTDFMFRRFRGLENLPVSDAYVPHVAGSFWDIWPGGWFEMCPNAGAMCTYGGLNLRQHGEVLYQVWDARVLCDREDCISVRFSVRVASMPLRLERTMTLYGDESTLYITSEITNESQQELSFVWGHHVTLGDGFINENCVIDMPSCRIENHPGAQPATSRLADQCFGTLDKMPAKNGGFLDERKILGKDSHVAEMLFAPSMPEAWCSITDTKKQLGFGLAWDQSMFPSTWIWKEFCASKNYPMYGSTYGLGIEPQVSDYPTLSGAVEKGKARMIQPGETLKSWITASTFTQSVPVYQSGRDGCMILK